MALTQSSKLAPILLPLTQTSYGRPFSLNGGRWPAHKRTEKRRKLGHSLSRAIIMRVGLHFSYGWTVLVDCCAGSKACARKHSHPFSLSAVCLLQNLCWRVGGARRVSRAWVFLSRASLFSLISRWKKRDIARWEGEWGGRGVIVRINGL